MLLFQFIPFLFPCPFPDWIHPFLFAGFGDSNDSQNGSQRTASRSPSASAQRCHTPGDVVRRRNNSDRHQPSAVLDSGFRHIGRQSAPLQINQSCPFGSNRPSRQSDERKPSIRAGHWIACPAATAAAATPSARLLGNTIRLQRQRNSRIGRPGLSRCRLLRKVGPNTKPKKEIELWNNKTFQSYYVPLCKSSVTLRSRHLHIFLLLARVKFFFFPFYGEMRDR